ncbi:unnamed protein product [Paramecium primaurelia]|uniref:Brl1/Brr6 domain-containing protein n=2 Tax=Paramecium TaxID=5884 RepID=A0A8S1UM27_9CILI|nr:unnamed protein product [Paramecium primaurelia]CAD8166050.1 unnamed protein product [Paramecium pentaurelia]
MSSENQITRFSEQESLMDLKSEFMRRINKNHMKMELSERKHDDGSLEKSIKLTPMTIGDFIGIWAIAILKSLFLICFLLMAYETYKDIQAHIDISKTQVLIEMKNCAAEYEQNQCSENYLIESMSLRCKELEICTNQNIEMKVRTQQLWLQVLGNSFEKMFKELSLKSCIMISFISIATSIIFIKN